MDFLKQKLLPQHAAMFLRDQVLKLDKEWNVIETNDSKTIPYYFFWLVHPKNYAAARLQYRLYIENPSNSEEREYNSLLDKLSDVRDDIYHSEEEWFKRELADIDGQKEAFDEYFHYLKKHNYVNMLKMHDNAVDRWSQFSVDGSKKLDAEKAVTEHEDGGYPKDLCHYIISVKVIDREIDQAAKHQHTYHVANQIAFSTKDQYLDGKLISFGLAGSGWVSPKYRSQPAVKFSMWYMKILMLINMNIRYCYAHVFADNVRSLGYISKSGMIPTKYRLKFLSFTQDIIPEQSVEETMHLSSSNSSNNSQVSYLQVKSLSDYKDLMHSIYGNSNFVIDKLQDIYNHPNFAGCYVDKQAKLAFQLWRCQFSQNQQTQEKVPAFVIFNISNLDGCDIPLRDSQSRALLYHLQYVVLPHLLKSSLSNNVSMVFATHGGSFYRFLLRNFTNSPNFSFASLYYTIQDNFQLRDGTPQPQEQDAVFKSLIHSQNSGEKNLFLDIRDCTGKPMVWSNEILQNEIPLLDKRMQANGNLSALAQNVFSNTKFSKL